MNKKQILILVIVTNVISITLVSMIFTYGQPEKNEPALAEVSQVQLIPEKPRQNIKLAIESIIEQYDAKSGSYQHSIDTYKQAIRNSPPYTAKSTAGYTYAKLGEYDKAIKLCEQYMQSSPSPAEYYSLAWIYAKIGKYDKAITVSKEVIQLHPRYPEIWHLLGWIHARLDENDKALDACKNALKLDPESALSHYALGRIYVLLEKPQQAIESYNKAIQLQSDYVEAYLFLGLAYAELGDQKQAIESYRQAILFDKYYPETYFFLGVSYDQSGQYKKAIDSFKNAIIWYHSQASKVRIHDMGIQPDMANVNFIIGVCYLRLDQSFEASVAFKKAIDIDDTHLQAHYGLALSHLLLDDKDAALIEYEAVKKLGSQQRATKLLEIINDFNP